MVQRTSGSLDSWSLHCHWIMCRNEGVETNDLDYHELWRNCGPFNLGEFLMYTYIYFFKLLIAMVVQNVREFLPAQSWDYLCFTVA